MLNCNYNVDPKNSICKVPVEFLGSTLNCLKACNPELWIIQDLDEFKNLFTYISQNSIDVGVLKTVNKTIDNIIKSSSITNLEVDVASINYLKNPQMFLSLLQKPDMMLSLSTLKSANQLASEFPFTPTELAKKTHYSNWQLLYKDIDAISKKYSVDIRGTNNQFHASISGGINRYSKVALKLLLDYQEGNSLDKYFDESEQ